MSLNFNPDDKRIEIPFSKIRIILALIMLSAFLVAGIWYIFNDAIPERGSPNAGFGFDLALGIMFIAVGGVGVTVLGFRLFNKNPGLVIDDSGIAINPGWFSSGFVEWSEILKFEVKPVSRTVFIFVYLKNPEEYIARESVSWKKRSLNFNFKVYKAPVCISANGLGDDSDELCSFLTKRLNEYNATKK